MALQKFVIPVLLIGSLTLAACSAAAPAAPSASVAAAATPEAAQAEPAKEVVAQAPTAAPAEQPAAAGEPIIYVVEPASSTVEWFGSKPIGASETGTVAIAEGQMSFAGDQLVAGTMLLDMATIATTSQSGGMAEQLLGHLASDDFFGVATYPTAKLVLKSAEPTDVANQYQVKADLTIKATTKEIEFVTDVTVADDALTGKAEITVNRADFDVRYNSAAFFSNLGDNLISDEMKITVTLLAKKG